MDTRSAKGCTNSTMCVGFCPRKKAASKLRRPKPRCDVLRSKTRRENTRYKWYRVFSPLCRIFYGCGKPRRTLRVVMYNCSVVSMPRLFPLYTPPNHIRAYTPSRIARERHVPTLAAAIRSDGFTCSLPASMPVLIKSLPL